MKQIIVTCEREKEKTGRRLRRMSESDSASAGVRECVSL